MVLLFCELLCGAACRMTGREDLVVAVAKTESLLFFSCQRKREYKESA